MKLNVLYNYEYYYNIEIKQDALRPHRSSEKKVQINKHITLIRRRKRSLTIFSDLNDFHLYKLKSRSSKAPLSQVLLKLVQWFWRIFFLNFVIILLLFHNYLPFEKGVALHSPKNALCKIWSKLAMYHMLKKIWKFRVNVFSQYHNYLPWKRAWPFISTYLNPFHPRMAQWVIVFAPQAEGWVFESQTRRT